MTNGKVSVGMPYTLNTTFSAPWATTVKIVPRKVKMITSQLGL